MWTLKTAGSGGQSIRCPEEKCSWRPFPWPWGFLMRSRPGQGGSSCHASLELFFLDEGFGTLDDNLLDVVMEALENLHSLSSRAIGLITHVERIQNQMPVKLLVKPAESGGKGSRTKLVYS